MARTTLSKFLIRSAATLVILALIVAAYNYFLINHSLEQIRIALSNASEAQSGSNPGSTAFLFQDILVSEISKPNLQIEWLSEADSKTEYLLSPLSGDQKSSVQFLLEDLLSSYQKNRPVILRAADSISCLLTDQFYKLIRLLEFLKQTRSEKQTSRFLEDAQLATLHLAREHELKWKFDEAAKAYEIFIKKYPSYPHIDLIRLNLASVYLRSREFQAAEKTLGEVRLATASVNEVKLVSMLKKKLKRQEELSKEREGLFNEIESSKTKSAVEGYTEKLFRLGVYDLHLFDLESAKKKFQEVLSDQPDPEMQKQVKWILAWIYLLQNNYPESRNLMRELLEKIPQNGY